jgi:UDP-N-acetylmuramoyl-tripeptide--D-alanyl-D-alanine ligase
VASKWQLGLNEVLAATGARCAYPGAVNFTGVGTDSRRDLTGQLFVALVGERFDAHDFIKSAVDQGAAGLLVHKSTPETDAVAAKIPVIETQDTLSALQSLARYWRRKHKFKVVGITGSNGKTSTKEFAKTVIASQFRTHASEGSFNNHWGVPMSLLAAPPGTEVVIQEMGMNHSGEITRLCEIAEPDIVVVTMVGRAHIGELGSQEAIAGAKEEIYKASPNAVQVFNLDNQWTIPMFERGRKALPRNKVFSFSGFRPEADVQMRAERMLDFRLEVTGQIKGVEGRAIVPVIGRHNVVNLMAASALGLALGIPPKNIWAGLAKCRPAWGRNQLVHLQNGMPVVFDGYNANPESMAALIKNLLEMDVAGKKIMVLGEMKELGHESARAHRELGEMVARSGVDLVWFMGPSMANFEAGLKAEKFEKSYFVSDTYEEKVARKLASMLNPTDIAVVKGSRSMEMEKVLQAWNPVDFEV